jgi:hypothetical protein
MATMPSRASLALLCGCAVCSCTLVDQRTFERHATGPSQSDLARASLPPLPLATIRFDRPNYDFRSDLGAAVEAAQSRKPDVVFDVVAVLPITASKRVPESDIRQAQADAAEVATALAAGGVSADKVRLGVHGDPGTPPREVLVYAR